MQKMSLNAMAFCHGIFVSEAKKILTICFITYALALNGQKSRVADSYQVLRYNNITELPEMIMINAEERPAPDIFLAFVKKVKGMESLDFSLIKVEADERGGENIRYQQVLDGMPVEASMLIAHCFKNKVISFNGNYFKTSATYSKASISFNEALQIAKTEIKADTYKWEIKTEELWIKEITQDINASFLPKETLVWVPKGFDRNATQLLLAYKIELFAHQPYGRYEIFVDANSGEIILSHNLIQTIDVPARARTKYSGQQQITTDSVAPGNFRLREDGRGNGLQTLNLRKGTDYAFAIDFSDSMNAWQNFNPAVDEAARDAHWGSELTFDYFKNTFNRSGIDGNNFRLISYVHYSTNYFNAFWNGYVVTYGDGNNSLAPLTSLDVCGHEITHGLTQKTANLLYFNESGALNESFSDIFGTAIEFFANPDSANFKVGEDFTADLGLRNMATPKLFQNPDTYKGQYWITGKADNGGVHYNSGVMNKWYYLLCKGDTGTNDNNISYSVDSIGLLNASKIAYRNLTSYLTPLSDYRDAWFYSMQAASDLFGECSYEMQQVAKAWYAVGVGPNWDTLPKASFYASKNFFCMAPATVSFFNTSTNAKNYFWDFGDGTTSTAIHPTKTYLNSGKYSVKLVVKSCNGAYSDSITLNNYIDIDNTPNFCNRYQMAVRDAGTLISDCSGILMDAGDTLNYPDLSYSTQVIAPPNSSTLLLNFLEFDLEVASDYFFIYDGNDTAGHLIGKFSGNLLPMGGKVICKSGAATLRFCSDYSISRKGFTLNWLCIPKTSSDLAIIDLVSPVSGRENTSSRKTNSEAIKVQILNAGIAAVSSYSVSVSINGANPVIKNITTPLQAGASAIVEVGQTDLTTLGNYSFTAWVRSGADANFENDTLTRFIKNLSNPPINLPFLENFENAGNLELYNQSKGIDGVDRIDYSSSLNSNGRGRLRTFAGAGFTGGNRAITLDKSNRFWLNDTQAIANYLDLTYNVSNFLKVPLTLRFSFMHHGDKKYSGDAVWVRGNDTAAWIRIYELFPNRTPASGNYKLSPVINLSYYLDSAGQKPSSSLQVRFGQEDNQPAINTQQFAGYTFENVRISTWGTGFSDEHETGFISVFPNPATQQVVISLDEEIKEATLSVSDVLGRILFIQHGIKNKTHPLNISNLLPGIYFINLFSNSNVYTERLIVY